MKKYSKILFLVSIFCTCFFLYSCKEYGGTIIVKNNYTEDKSVTIYSDLKGSGGLYNYKDKYGPKNISAGGSDIFSVDSNTNYGIVWRDAGIDNIERVDVSDGETVDVTIP